MREVEPEKKKGSEQRVEVEAAPGKKRWGKGTVSNMNRIGEMEENTRGKKEGGDPPRPRFFLRGGKEKGGMKEFLISFARRE